MKNIFSKFISSKKGFSLAELVITIGLTGVLALGVTQVLKQQTLTGKKSEANLDTSIFMNAIQFNLFKRGSTVCATTFAGETQTAAQEIIITRDEAIAGGAGRLINSDTLGANLDFVELRLENPREEGKVITSNSKVISYSGIVVFRHTSIAYEGVPTIERRLSFPVLLHLTDANTVIDCIDPEEYLIDKTQEELCLSIGGTIISASAIGGSTNDLNVTCTLNTPARPAKKDQNLIGVTETIVVGNAWADPAVGNGDKLVSRDDLTTPVTHTNEDINGRLVISNGEVIARFTSGQQVQNISYTGTGVGGANQPAVNIGLPRCWLTGEPCGSSTSSNPTVNPVDSGVVMYAKCDGGSGIGNSGCVSLNECPPGFYTAGVSNGYSSQTSPGGSSLDAYQPTQGPKGSIRCLPIAQNAECSRGEGIELINMPDGRITVNCASTPPSYANYNCTNTGWSLPSGTCGGASGACLSGSASPGDSASCCSSTPAGICNTAPGLCIAGDPCVNDTQCGGTAGSCVAGGGATCSGSFTVTPPSGSCTAGSGGAFISCFLSGTQITMADGSKKNIENLIDGEIVRTMTPDATLEGREYTLASIHKTMTAINSGYKYGINGSKYGSRNVFVTGGHPFMTIDGSWKAFEPENAPIKERKELKLSKLDLGDILVREDGLEAIITFYKEKTQEIVYNFEVSGVHEYIAQGYRVHNKTSCTVGTFPCSGSNVCVNASGMGISSGSGTCSRGCSNPGTVSSNSSWCNAGEEVYCGDDNNWHCRTAGSGGCGSGAPLLADCDFLMPIGFTASDCTSTHPNCTYTAGGNTCSCPSTAINGACGSADGSSYATLSSGSANLCNPGSDINFTDNGTNWTWNCAGSGGGSDSSQCLATNTTPAPVNGVCGSADGSSYTTLSSGSTDLCSSGSDINFTDNGTDWTWNCSGSNGGSDSSQCLATAGAGTFNQYTCDAAGAWVLGGTCAGPDSPECLDWSTTATSVCCNPAIFMAGKLCGVGTNNSCVGTFTNTYETGGSCDGGTFTAGSTSGGCIGGIQCGGFGMGLPVGCVHNQSQANACAAHSSEAACDAGNNCAWIDFSGMFNTGPATKPCSDINTMPDGGWDVFNNKLLPTRKQYCNQHSACNWTPVTATDTFICDGPFLQNQTSCNAQAGCNWQIDTNVPPQASWQVSAWDSCAGFATDQTRTVTCPTGFTCPLAPPPTTRPCSGGSGGKVICGELFRQGYMSKEIIIADNNYADDNISPKTLRLYQAWANPLVNLMRSSSVVTQIVKPYGVGWAQHMAYLEGATEQDNYLGYLLHSNFLPIHDMIVNQKSSGAKEMGKAVPHFSGKGFLYFIMLVFFLLCVIGVVILPIPMIILFFMKNRGAFKKMTWIYRFNIFSILILLSSAFII